MHNFHLKNFVWSHCRCSLSNPCYISHRHFHAGSKLSADSLMLGSSPGGGLMYVEPPAAVSLNNELAAARGECYSAEEEVLWDLTGRLYGMACVI